MKPIVQKLKVMTILGTRPEIIRLSRVLPKLDQYVHHVTVYTRQSFDYEMSDIFFKELGLRRSDYTLEVKAETLGEQIAHIIRQSEDVLIREKPDAVLILGDTNSSLSAIVAKRMGIPIFHMEAGNRAFDWDVPEEVNRRIIDHIADYNFAYTEHARRYLLAEGIAPETVIVTGSVYPEILVHYKKKIDACTILKHLKVRPRKYFLVSSHREENVENPDRLSQLLGAFEFLAQTYKVPVIVSVHPRTRKKIQGKKFHPLIRLEKPFGFFEFVKLEKNALCVLSDSGTIQEESAILGFAAVQIRVSTERPEAFDTGSIVLTGFNKDTIATAIKLTLDEERKKIPLVVPRDYRDTNVSTKVVKFLLGLTSIRANPR